MTKNQRYFFRNEDKLKSRKAIGELFNSGKQFSNYPFKVVWIAKNEKAVLQAGISVSSRYFKKATDRNRIKRLMREAYRLQKNPLRDHLQENSKQLSVFILYTGKELPGYEVVFEKIGSVMTRLIKLTNANNKENS